MTLLLRILARLHSAALLLLPRDIRRVHGREMRDTSRLIVEDTLRRRGPWAAAAAGVAECADVIVAASRATRRAPEMFRQDLTYAWRLLWQRPMFTATVVGTLAIGIGATTTVFTAVNALLLRPLPYGEPDRLVMVTTLSRNRVSTSLSPLDYQDITAGVRSIESASAFDVDQLNMTGGGEPERVDVGTVTWNFFDVIAVRPLVGRSFTVAEGEAGNERVAVISHGLWQRRFGADRSIVGQSITFDGQPYTVVGVAPPQLVFPGRPAAWRPLVFTRHEVDPSQRGARWIQVLARMRRGATLDRARSEVGTVAARLAADFPRTHSGRGAALTPLQEMLVQRTRPGLIALFGAVTLVLLIACANVANLLLARSAARASEMAIRTALGASRARLLQQCLVENLLLTTIAAGAAVATAAWAVRAAAAVMADTLPRASEIQVDGSVLVFAVGCALVLAVMLGIITALGIGSRAPAGMTSATRSTPRHMRVVRRSLVVAEVAMALVLATAAGLFLKSLVRLYGVPPGFDPSQILTFSVTLPDTSYKQPEQVADFVRRLREGLSGRPGVESAGGVFGLPLTSVFSASGNLEIVGRPVASPENEPRAAMRIVTPGYFRTLRIPVKTGRDFDDRDAAAAPGVAIINEAAARKYWPGENPIGQQLRMHISLTSVPQPRREIVGIAGDVRYGGLDADPQAEVYIPHAQHPVDALTITVRTKSDPRHFMHDARGVLRQLDPNLPLSSLATMEDIVADSVAARRFSLMMLAGFAGCALLLAVLGIYGMLSYTVGRRTAEIGVRMAMGARRADVLRLVVGEGVTLVVVGLAIGLVATLAVTRGIRELLYDVTPYDPDTIGLVGVSLIAVSVAASYLPARRAASIDPVSALRHE
jgi:putative ABC transport system permease protein